MYFAFAAVPGPPAAPDVGNVLSASCTVKYELPEDEGDAPVTGYYVQRRSVMTGADGEWETVNEMPVTSLKLFVDRLQSCSRYQFRVAAENEKGIGDFGPPSETVTCLQRREDECSIPRYGTGQLNLSSCYP